MRTHASPRRRDWWLWPLAALAGLLFFASLGRLWPLADVDLTVPRATLRARAERLMETRRLLVPPRKATDYVVATQLSVDEPVLEYVERTFGQADAQALIRGGAPLVEYDVAYKRHGDSDDLDFSLDGAGRPIAWLRGMQDDTRGAHLPVDSARALARAALTSTFGLPIDSLAAMTADGAALRARWATAPWAELGSSSRERPARLDHTFTFERLLSKAPELRERVIATVSGDEVTGLRRALLVPARGQRAARTRSAPTSALRTAGLILMAAGVLGALVVFLLRLRDGTVRLARAAYWSAIVFACAFLTSTFGDYGLLVNWDPLWPRWIATLVTLGYLAQSLLWMFVVLLALIAAADAIDRETGAGRGDTLWRLGRGGIADPAVGLASLRGFAVGLLCGGVLTIAVLGLQRVTGFSGLQPRGFFFYALNSTAPSLGTLLFFTNIALLEEFGYRFFAGPWLLAATKRRWIAIVLPAVVYGLTHTGLSFLPPAEPYWGRAVVITLVGCVWGWALLRYDALTVVISHLTADLFIFNWPRLASVHPDVKLAALITVSVPLLPAIVAGIAWLLGRRRTGELQSAA